MFNSQTRKGPELVADAGMKCVVMEQMEQWTEVIVVNTIIFFFVAIAIITNLLFITTITSIILLHSNHGFLSKSRCKSTLQVVGGNLK